MRSVGGGSLGGGEGVGVGMEAYVYKLFKTLEVLKNKIIVDQ